MQIIPVLDLKQGQVVHAVRGERNHYQAIARFSKLTTKSDIDTVLASFWRIHDFNTFYIADLDAICQQGNHDALIMAVVQAYPQVEFWVDQGRPFAERQQLSAKNLKPVIGTESQLQAPEVATNDYILSLDYRQQALGHVDWFTASEYWPDQVIVMSLQRVGSGLGPDLARLSAMRQQQPDKQIIAAGGVRGMQDIRQLTDLGVHGVLLASALHDGSISAVDLASPYICAHAV